MSRRITAIDIGTVTCRLLIADVVDGRVIELEKGYAITNLGEGVDASGMLSVAAMHRVCNALDGFLAARDALSPAEGIADTIVIATSASRDARNADEFAEMLRAKGIELTVIPGEREAALSFLGASGEFQGEDVLVVDIGGGSTELIMGKAGDAPLMSHSFDIGCRRVTERFLHADPPAQVELEEARAWIHDEMGWFFEKARADDVRFNRVVAVAGTATSVVSIRDEMRVYDSARVHRAEVTLSELDDVVRRLSSLSLAEREDVVGLDPRRAPVIVAGLVILREVLRLAGAGGFTASECDILQGIVLDAVR